MQQIIEFIASEDTAFAAFWICVLGLPIINIITTKKDNELP
jgi:hypothetical protein